MHEIAVSNTHTPFVWHSSFISPKMFLFVGLRVENHGPVDALSLGEHADRFVDADLKVDPKWLRFVFSFNDFCE